MKLYIRSLVLFCFLLPSCTNKPGSLQLFIILEKLEVKSDEPIRIQAMLSAIEGQVCLNKDYSFLVKVCPVNDTSRMMASEQQIICGTPFVASLPFTWPVYAMGIVVAYLDVADALGRFEIIKKGEKRTYNFSVIPMQENSLTLLDMESHSFLPQVKPKWKYGDYQIKLRLVYSDNMGIYPAPFFWNPYSHPVEAEGRIRIID